MASQGACASSGRAFPDNWTEKLEKNRPMQRVMGSLDCTAPAYRHTFRRRTRSQWRSGASPQACERS